ncbi:MAG: imidazoleglycerol-phosphate dehydratase HisB [Clostridiales bacterium]|nr:imidazoleglycerol-phosphate dehydratase HisB [Clostridiales bacterium]
MRSSDIIRTTKETDISLKLSLDGGDISVDTGCGFLDHMLILFATHGRFGLKLSCKGDVYVDYHHSTEDIGICLGLAFAEALGDKAGIVRYGDVILPMDEALIMCSVDISGRAYLAYEVRPPAEKVGDFDTELVKEFFYAFTRTSGVTLHIRQLAGENSHHILEGVFKAFARVLRKASSLDPDSTSVPSSKGVL